MRPIVTTGVRRVGFASRSGITGAVTRVRARRTAWPTWPGCPTAPRRRRRLRRDVRDGFEASIWWSPSREIQTSCRRLPRRRPGRRTSRAGRPSRRRRRPAGTGSMYVPSALSMATIRAFGLVVGVDPARASLVPSRAGHHRVDRGRSQERVLGRPWPPSRRSCRRRSGSSSPSVGREHVAVDVQRGHLVTSRAVASQAGACAGKPLPSAAGE